MIAGYNGTSANSRRRVQTTLERHNIVDTVQHTKPWWLMNRSYTPYQCTRQGRSGSCDMRKLLAPLIPAVSWVPVAALSRVTCEC